MRRVMVPVMVLSVACGGGAAKDTPVGPPPGDTLPPAILTRLPVSGGNVGQAFQLAVDGQRFTQTSTVQWNGADRPTTYISDTRLTAAISAADGASPGVVRITVRTPGAPVSSPLSFTLRAVPLPALTAFTVVRIPAQDLVYDPPSDRLYAAVGTTGPLANTVAVIDPHTGTITGSVFVGPDLRRIVRSDDGKYLYVTVNGNADVRRVQVSPLTAQLQFTPGEGGVGWRIGDLCVVPGNNRALAIVRLSSGSPNDVRIFDDDKPRPVAVGSYPTSPGLISFGADATTLYGFDNFSSARTFYTMNVGASGLSTTAAKGVQMVASRMVWNNGRIYTDFATIVDPDQPAILGKVSEPPGVGGTVLIDPSLGRALFFHIGDVAAYDLNNYSRLGAVAMPDSGIVSGARYPTRWGADGIAFTDGQSVFILRTTLVSP